jgi:hypothetical protein
VSRKFVFVSENKFFVSRKFVFISENKIFLSNFLIVCTVANPGANLKSQKRKAKYLRVVDILDANMEVEATARGGHVVRMRVDGQRAELVARVQLQLV